MSAFIQIEERTPSPRQPAGFALRELSAEPTLSRILVRRSAYDDAIAALFDAEQAPTPLAA